MDDVTVFVEPVGHSEALIVSRADSVQCHRCQSHGVGLFFDSSGGEYGGAWLCCDCLIALIDTKPSVPCRHEMRTNPNRSYEYCRNCGDSAWRIAREASNER